MRISVCEAGGRNCFILATRNFEIEREVMQGCQRL